MKLALYQLSYRATDDSFHIEALRYRALGASWLHPTACRRPKHFDVEREVEIESTASTLATSALYQLSYSRNKIRRVKTVAVLTAKEIMMLICISSELLKNRRCRRRVR